MSSSEYHANGSDSDEDWMPEKLPALPASLDRRPSWDELEASASVPSPESRPDEVSEANLRKVLEQLGLERFPPSYVQYCSRLGHVHEWELAYRADGYPRFLTISAILDLPGLQKSFGRVLESMSESSPEARSVADELRRLVRVGTDASRTELCWSRDGADESGELPLCFVDFNADEEDIDDVRISVGQHLLDVLKYYKHHS